MRSLGKLLCGLICTSVTTMFIMFINENYFRDRILEMDVLVKSYGLPCSSVKTGKTCTVFTSSWPQSTIDSLRYIKLKSDLHLFINSTGDTAYSDLVWDNGWEHPIAKGMETVLMEDKSLNLIDIGCDVGIFTLNAASLGRSVVAVDASLANLHLVDASLTENELRDCVTLLHNTISDKRIDFTMQSNETARPIVTTNLLETISFRKAMLRVYVDSDEEYHFFQEAQTLFTRIDIPYVLMRWTWSWRARGTEPLTTAEMERALFIISFFMQSRYTAYPSLFSKTMLFVHNFTDWPIDIVWRR